MTENLINRISFYLASGGLFNPELADHLAVRNLLMECREVLAQTEQGWTPERIAGMARLKEAQDKKLAQPEQEYHAVNAVHKGQQCYVKTQTEQDSGIVTAGGFDPRTQRTWVGLTPQERDEINEQVYGAAPHHVAFHAVIEAKLKEKNT